MIRILISFFFCFISCIAARIPNILFAFADDWGQQAGIYADVLGKGGINDLAKTPNFDKLAKGVCSLKMLLSMHPPVPRAEVLYFREETFGRRVGEQS